MPTRPPTEPSIPNPPVPPDSKFVTLSVQAGGVSPSTGNRVALLEGASVVIRNRGQTVALGTTNRDGIFSARIEPGTLEISVTHPDYTSQTDRFVLGVSSASHRILLRAAQQSPPPRPSVTPPVTMPGAVRNPTLTIQVGGKDPGGSNQVTLLGAANVTIVSSNQVRARGVSAAGGVYSAELPPGQYELQISHPGYYDQKSTVTLQSASTTHRVLLNPRRKID